MAVTRGLHALLAFESFEPLTLDEYNTKTSFKTAIKNLIKTGFKTHFKKHPPSVLE
jgi:hypothetical protein